MSNRIPLKHGGMFRCCIDTINDFCGEEKEGTELYCKVCGDTLRVEYGRWTWVQPAPIIK